MKSQGPSRNRNWNFRRLNVNWHYVFWVICVSVVIGLSILTPEFVSGYLSKSNLEKEFLQEGGAFAAGYRYSLTSSEKIYILSMALNNWVLPQSDYFASVRERATIANVQSASVSYAFMVNYKGPDYNELTREKAIAACKAELEILNEANIIPACGYPIDEQSYDATLYSAVDVLEPQKNVSVWQISLIAEQYAGKNTLLDAYCDAETGQIYGFSMTTDSKWEDFDADQIINGWCDYLRLGSPREYTADSRLMETTPYFKKYTVAGATQEETIITIGFYEGTQELFLRISD